MAALSREIGEKILARQSELVRLVVDRHYEIHPDLAERYGPNGRAKCGEDAAYHFGYLAEALSMGEPELFADYVAWAKVMLAARGIPANDLASNLRVLWDVLVRELPREGHGIIARFVGTALDRIPQYPTQVATAIHDEEPHSQLAQQYVQALLRGERETAGRLVLDSARAGTPVRDLYTFVFERSQQEIGRLWQLNQISVAHEHYCTAATQVIMAQLYPYIFGGEKNGRHAVGACAAGELHELGVRMVCDFLEMEGWSTTYLGANVPIQGLLRILEERDAGVLALSATMTYHVHVVRQIIEHVRQRIAAGTLRIIVGGYGFRKLPDLWRKIGADGFARDAREAITVANQVVASEGL